MSIYHLSKAELIRKIELDEQAVKRAYSYQQEVKDLTEKLKAKPKEVVKEVIKEVKLPVEVVKTIEVPIYKEDHEVTKKLRETIGSLKQEIAELKKKLSKKPTEVKVPYEVVEAVIKEVLPSWADEGQLKSFQKVRQNL